MVARPGAGEASDPKVYARGLIAELARGEPRYRLIVQGIEGSYIPPPVANALSLALGLERAASGLEPSLAELSRAFGRAHLEPPVAGNHDAGVTAVVVQHPEDGVKDGHEVFFQWSEPKTQLRSFLWTWRAGEPPVRSGPPDGEPRRRSLPRDPRGR